MTSVFLQKEFKRIQRYKIVSKFNNCWSYALGNEVSRSIRSKYNPYNLGIVPLLDRNQLISSILATNSQQLQKVRVFSSPGVYMHSLITNIPVIFEDNIWSHDFHFIRFVIDENLQSYASHKAGKTGIIRDFDDNNTPLNISDISQNYFSTTVDKINEIVPYEYVATFKIIGDSRTWIQKALGIPFF